MVNYNFKNRKDLKDNPSSVLVFFILDFDVIIIINSSFETILHGTERSTRGKKINEFW